MDEPSSEYGLLAEAVAYPDDFSFVRYRLRRRARWHDGAPVTAERRGFFLLRVQEGQSAAFRLLQARDQSEITAEREITFTFDSPGNRELPQIMGQLNVLPKHWWEDNDPRECAAMSL